MTGSAHRTQTGTASRSCSRSTHGQATAANQRIAEALGTRDTEQDLGDEGDGDMEQAS